MNLALERYRARVPMSADAACVLAPVRAVLFDMDGVLYDSMPGHAVAWKRMCDDIGIACDPDEFFGYEGMTGAATIRLLFKRQWGTVPSDDECRRLYGIKSEYFKAMGLPKIMPGAPEAVAEVLKAGVPTVLVTGSGQASILERLAADYPGAFAERVTAHDVVHGKPDPEPYLRGMERVGALPWQSVAIDNAPLGVESASRAGAFTIGVRTGPLAPGALTAAGADIEVPSMAAVAELLRGLLRLNK